MTTRIQRQRFAIYSAWIARPSLYAAATLVLGLTVGGCDRVSHSSIFLNCGDCSRTIAAMRAFAHANNWRCSPPASPLGLPFECEDYDPRPISIAVTQLQPHRLELGIRSIDSNVFEAPPCRRVAKHLGRIAESWPTVHGVVVHEQPEQEPSTK